MKRNAFFNFEHKNRNGHYISIYVERSKGKWVISDMLSIDGSEMFPIWPSEYELFFLFKDQWSFIGMQSW